MLTPSPASPSGLQVSEPAYVHDVVVTEWWTTKRLKSPPPSDFAPAVRCNRVSFGRNSLTSTALIHRSSDNPVGAKPRSPYQSLPRALTVVIGDETIRS